MKNIFLVIFQFLPFIVMAQVIKTMECQSPLYKFKIDNYKQHFTIISVANRTSSKIDTLQISYFDSYPAGCLCSDKTISVISKDVFQIGVLKVFSKNKNKWKAILNQRIATDEIPGGVFDPSKIYSYHQYELLGFYKVKIIESLKKGLTSNTKETIEEWEYIYQYDLNMKKPIVLQKRKLK